MDKNTEKVLQRAEKIDPSRLKLEGEHKIPSEWARLAQEAETEGRWGDAHHYWVTGSTAHTRNKGQSKQMKIRAFKVFEKWQKNL